MINLQQLALKLSSAGLMQKSFADCSKEQINAICNAVLTSVGEEVPADGWTKPYIDDNDDLQLLFTSHPKYHWWKPDGQSLMETLSEIMAPYPVAKKYINPHISETEYLNKMLPF